jgi:threonine-phosphate decarboxylase
MTTKIKSAKDPTTFSGGIHGGDIWGAARRLGLPLSQVLDLSASLNPLGPPAGLQEEIGRACDLICHYPDRQNLELRQALADYVNLEPENILPGNGSTALIRLVARAMDFRRILILAPAFGEFSHSLALTGRHFHFHMLPEAANFSPANGDLEKIWKAAPSCVILTNPVTPSGGLVDTGFLTALLRQSAARNCWVILDEAFIDFAPKASRTWSPSQVLEHPKLLVLRSLTKFFCLAGLRLGYLLGHRSALGQIAPLGEPWSVNTLASRAGVYCLAQEEYAQKTRAAMDRWREELINRLQGLGLKVYPSQVNYLLVRLPQNGPTAAQVAESCAHRAILLRDCASFPGCSPYHLRLAVCPPEEQERLFEVLEPALAAGGE